MIGVRLSVPVASWRKAHARELLETESVPPPATCYGALLSLVGELDRDRHQGCRVTGGVIGEAYRSVVVRTLWKIKDRKTPQGSGENAKPDFQQLLTGCDVMIWCDSTDEAGEGLEQRVVRALTSPAEVDRFGGWSLGESSHLVNDAHLVSRDDVPRDTRAFLMDHCGTLTLPVWVDHVGMRATRYVVGRLESVSRFPEPERIPSIHGHG
jgi:CRISPR-associated protein Cas5t